jgi:hypothetical protein
MKFNWKLNCNKVFFIFSVSFFSCLTWTSFSGSKLTDHIQIMAIQQQKGAMTEAKRTQEFNIKMKAQTDSISAGMIAPPPITDLPIFNSLQLPALPSPPTSPDLERDDLTSFVFQFSQPPPGSAFPPILPPASAQTLTLAPLTCGARAGDCITITGTPIHASGVPAPTGLPPNLADDVVMR